MQHSCGPGTGTHKEYSAGKGLFSWYWCNWHSAGRVAGNTWQCQSSLSVLAAPTNTQGEAVVTVAMEGARAVVADMVAGARLCLALIYVWERREKGKSCAKGTGSVWHGQGKGWRGHEGGQLQGWVNLEHKGR